MGSIQILDGALADQIAAGEVVERPASVVKELLENALDAGARSITVDVRAGGTEHIRVSDDGSGMDEHDAARCVLRHATSKIRTSQDLEAIRTLGFRGEALPSIASVSRVRLVTRERSAMAGTEVVVDGGAPARSSPIGCAVGTIVEVSDLFFNVPARKKFLKSTATESAMIGEVCLRAALSAPELRLTLLRDGKRSREYPPARSWAERAAAVVEGKSVRVERERGGLSLRALLGAPEDARSGATALYVFVNGRAVRDRSLARCVAYAYGSVLPPGRYPTGVVYLEIDPSEVDVNVHPQKAEVRFARGRELLDLATKLLAEGLGTSAFRGPTPRHNEYWTSRLPPGPVADPHPLETPSIPESDPWGLGPATSPAPPPTTPPSGWPSRTPPPSWPARTPAPPQPPLPYARPSEAASQLRDAELGEREVPPSISPARPYRALAQSKRLYIVAESERGLVVFDQHAADERIKYDRLRRQLATREIATQRLLLPARLELSEREARLLESHADEVGTSGLEAQLIGPTTAAISAVPALLARAAPERLLRDLLDELSRQGERSFGDAIDTALATMACHGAIRAGDPLSLPECQALLDAVAAIEEFGEHCPHGRPILLELPFSDLAKKVGR